MENLSRIARYVPAEHPVFKGENIYSKEYLSMKEAERRLKKQGVKITRQTVTSNTKRYPASLAKINGKSMVDSDFVRILAEKYRGKEKISLFGVLFNNSHIPNMGQLAISPAELWQVLSDHLKDLPKAISEIEPFRFTSKFIPAEVKVHKEEIPVASLLERYKTGCENEFWHGKDSFSHLLCQNIPPFLCVYRRIWDRLHASYIELNVDKVKDFWEIFKQDEGEFLKLVAQQNGFKEIKTYYI